MLSPPVRTFLKAGFGGMSLLEKVGVLYLTSALDDELPHIEGQDEDGFRYLPWRTSLIPAFIEEPKLYVEFPRAELQDYLRLLLDVAMEYNL
eukprot:8661817-Alexandrium_andersonii.AAC.1